MFFIRQETPSDYEQVYLLVKQAFAKASHCLWSLKMRSKGLSDNVLYTRAITTQTGAIEALVLSPISVLPDCFGKGIARAMIESAVKRAASMGYIAVFLCGTPEIYSKLGFKPSYEFEIYHKAEQKPHGAWGGNW